MRGCVPMIALLVCACFGEESMTGSASGETNETGAATTTMDPATTDPTTTTTMDPSTTTIATSSSETSTTVDPDSSTTGTDSSSVDTTDTDTTCRHRVFLSEAEPRGVDVVSFANASELCQQEADDSSLGGAWVAVLSDDTPAVDNVTICGNVYLADDGEGTIDDTLVATIDKWWTNEHEHAIDRHADGAVLDMQFSSSAAWTGTDVGGDAHRLDCGGWGDPGESGQWGLAIVPPGRGSWISEGSLACDQALHLFCIEQFG